MPLFHPIDIRDETWELVIELWKKKIDGSGVETCMKHAQMRSWAPISVDESLHADIKKPRQFESLVSKCLLVPVCPRREYLMRTMGYPYFRYHQDLMAVCSHRKWIKPKSVSKGFPLLEKWHKLRAPYAVRSSSTQFSWPISNPFFCSQAESISRSRQW